MEQQQSSSAWATPATGVAEPDVSGDGGRGSKCTATNGAKKARTSRKRSLVLCTQRNNA